LYDHPRSRSARSRDPDSLRSPDVPRCGGRTGHSGKITQAHHRFQSCCFKRAKCPSDTFRTYFETRILKYTLWLISEHSYNKYSVLFLLVYYYYYYYYYCCLLCFAHPNPTCGQYSPASEGLTNSHSSG